MKEIAMTMPATTASAPARLADRIVCLFTLMPYWLIALGARIALIRVFWWSARTRVVPGTWFSLNDTTTYLFENEFRIHLPWTDFALPVPDLFAWVTMTCEHLFPILLVLGLGTRFAGLGLFGMTMVIESIYPENYNEHLPWAICCLVLIKWGGGIFSLDALIAKVSGRKIVAG
jgi:putative oxidoreductase